MNESAALPAAWFASLLEQSRFLARYPQFAAVLARMEPMATAAIPVMAVARHWRADREHGLRLYVNTGWLRQHPEHFAGVLQHEIHHVVCGHLDDARLHHVELPQLMELAMEFAANENITEPLPDGFRWQAFAEFGLAAGQTTMERYELLRTAAADGRLQLLDEDQLDAIDPDWRTRTGADADAQGPRVVVMPKRRSGLPAGGGGPGAPRPQVHGKVGRPEHRPGAEAGRGDRGLGDALDRAGDGARPGTWDGRGWLMPPTDARQIELWQLQIRAHLRGEAGGRGDGADGGLRAAKELSRPVQAASDGRGLAWPSILRQVLRSPRRVQPSYLRPNRRFPERLGELPGRVRRPRRLRLLVGLDTSASMDTAILAAVLGELARLRRCAEVITAEVDAAVQRVHRGDPGGLVQGGGDTDFEPLFALAAGDRGLDGIVYFTDGVGRWPVAAPAVPVLWVLTGELAFDCPWGTVVRLRGGFG